MINGLALNGHRQVAHVSEIGLGHLAGRVRLRKEDFARRAGLRAPGFSVALQSAQLRRLKLAHVNVAEVVKDGDRFDGRVGVKQLLDLWPDAGERIRPSAPKPGRFELAGDFASAAILARGLFVHDGFRGRLHE